jgi:hypothetical protein
MFANVVVGVDGRQGGRDAIALARQLAAPDAAITLAHVYGGGSLASKTAQRCKRTRCSATSPRPVADCTSSPSSELPICSWSDRATAAPSDERSSGMTLAGH